MKRGGLAFTILVVTGGLLRLVGPGSSMQDSQSSTLREPQTKGKAEAKRTYLEQLRGTIRESYPAGDGTPHDDPYLAEHLNVPRPVREHVRFVVAILPDPVHTHLAMLFDRSVEALQLAAQRQGYAFDRAILPWERTAHPEPADFKLREEEAEDKAQRETYPGLLVFRAGPDWQSPSTHQAAPNGPLFVFVVGETPTGGIHREQFRNALDWIRQIRGTDASKGEKNLLILGPTFSGSLESLGRELEHQPAQHRAERVLVYSGTITNAEAEERFAQDWPQDWPSLHLVSFQENDAYALHEFLGFARYLSYDPSEIAVLSEAGTIYGKRPKAANYIPTADASAGAEETLARLAQGTPDAQQSVGCGEKSKSAEKPAPEDVVQLHFPREISYMRAAYQKVAQAQQQPTAKAQSRSTLPLDLNEGGDDDTVPPYASLQTPLSQEAVMMGIVSELHKHHIKFTVLMATNPLDVLFLARYLRQAYPQGRVVITVPDLLLNRQDDALLHGVMGLNIYPLVPGLRDRLRQVGQPLDVHEDSVFVSSSSVGTFNAMVGLLSVRIVDGKDDTLPNAPYAEYGSPLVENDAHSMPSKVKPILWLTMLGRDGYWPIVGINGSEFTTIDRQNPILYVPKTPKLRSTIKEAIEEPHPKSLSEAHTPPVWMVAYFLVTLILAGHGILSAYGSILADSEAQAQFARNTRDVRGAIILALGALALSTGFVLIMCTRNPFITWPGFTGLTTLLWLPYPLFVGLTIVDLGKWRGQPRVAALFALLVCVMTGLHILLVSSRLDGFRMYWSTRVLHLSSGLSPVLPMLLLLGAGYWWMWISLKGIALVDLRRPRLPGKEDLPLESYRISDTEAEQLRNVSHPFFFNWQVMIPTIALAAGFLTISDLRHPIQTLEGKPFDWGYSLLLALMVATFLGCLLKLVITWFKCRQVLVGLDRLPLRHAFGRMKRLSWNSLWTPGGSTLRETYKIMSRALENLGRLRRILEEDWGAPIPMGARIAAREQVCRTMLARQAVYEAYTIIMKWMNPPARKEQEGKSKRSGLKKLRKWLGSMRRIRAFSRRHQRRARKLQELMGKVGALQKEMARMAAVLIRQVLRVWWSEETGPVVSEDEGIEKEKLPAIQALAEEYVAIMYVNFLASVLLRIRTLVICAGGLYVLIVLSVSVYPFEPHSALQTMMVLLLIVMAVVVGYVYAEMHREAILSRLTSTKAGELGWDFWLKFASAAAIPVLSLLAGQFPEINQILFSWLEPALQAMK